MRLEQLEVGERDFVFVTTASGLYRYDMNGIIEVVGMYEQTPLIRFVQKSKVVISFTGKKLYEVEVIAAGDEALATLRDRYHFIAAVAELGNGATRPRLVFLIEFDDTVTDHEGSMLVDRSDEALGDQNSEYPRGDRRRYGASVIRIVRPGEFDKYRRRMVERGRADGQFKIFAAYKRLVAEFEGERNLVSREWSPVLLRDDNVLPTQEMMSGHASTGQWGTMSRGRLTSSSQNKMIAGVCGGLAQFYGISSKRVRWAFFVFGLLGAGEVVDIVLWILLPKDT
jgi:phage shock protein PspC (stress-responsive transcriptional regulator)